MQAQLQQHDYHAMFLGLLTGTGLTPDNLADVYAGYSIVGWMVVNGQTSDPPARDMAGVKRQWADALGRTRFATNVEARRRAAEELKIKMVVINAGWRDAAKTGQTVAYAAGIDALYRSQLKMNMRAYCLSPAGFVAK